MNDVLTISLEAAVPLWIERHRDTDPSTRNYRALELSGVIASHGDDLMYGGKHCAETFNALAEGLALMAYSPGGVKFAGLHWQAYASL